ncbi:hypothetical protein C8R44DRAFT_890213 [Mycena epipterygia]|nr:hypothetical protein C8R44DRAFT_890213 [Mycena epipterygia]
MCSPTNRDPNAGNEAYSAKLWAVYVSEAEKYDRALVETWRSNMDGMLIYAGLFSASLTAFLTESYRTLNPDPGQTTIILLTQISHQLAAASNGSHFELPAPSDSFTPPTTSLVCNALWFISLSLSLSCALIATLLEQWARDFIHNSDIRSAPVIRARVFSYLYYGLKRFNMHTVVEIVPLLLHASLLLFFAGLVTFLAPVNPIIMTVVATSLGVVAAVYSALTLLPLIYLDCPYRTPLSGTLWRLGNALRQRWNRNRPGGGQIADTVPRPQPDGIVEAIYRQATEQSADRTSRDLRALVWTVKSLTADEELEPFVESISDILWSPEGRRTVYDVHISTLIYHPDVQLWARIEGLLQSCNSGLLSAEAKTRRHIICYTALWSMASLLIDYAGDSSPDLDFLPDLSLVHKSIQNDPCVEHYAASARALIRWRWFCAFKNKIFDTFKYLTQCKTDLGRGRLPNLHPVVMFFDKIQQHVAYFPFLRGVVWSEYLRQLQDNDPNDVTSTSSLIENILQSLDLFSTDIPFIIMFDYLRECASLDALPHQFEVTLSTITPQDPSFSFAGTSHLYLVMHDIVYRHLDRLNTTAETHFVDEIIGILNSIWQQGTTGNPVLPRGTIEYLNRRNSDSAVSCMLDRGDPIHIISAITVALTTSLSVVDNFTDTRSVAELLTALWRLVVLSPPLPQAVYEAALDAVSKMDTSYYHPSIIALIKTNILKTFSFNPCGTRARMTADDIKSRLSNRILPADTSFNISVEMLGQNPEDEIQPENLDALNQVLRDRITEARIMVVSEFFESCSSTALPNNAVETVPFVAHFVPPASVHVKHQTRFANSIRGIFEQSRSHPGFLDAVIQSKIFDVYAAGHGVQNAWCIPGLLQKHPWLDYPVARRTIQNSLGDYAATLSPSESPAAVARISSILRGMDSLHSA